MAQRATKKNISCKKESAAQWHQHPPSHTPFPHRPWASEHPVDARNETPKVFTAIWFFHGQRVQMTSGPLLESQKVLQAPSWSLRWTSWFFWLVQVALACLSTLPNQTHRKPPAYGSSRSLPCSWTFLALPRSGSCRAYSGPLLPNRPSCLPSTCRGSCIIYMVDVSALNHLGVAALVWTMKETSRRRSSKSTRRHFAKASQRFFFVVCTAWMAWQTLRFLQSSLPAAWRWPALCTATRWEWTLLAHRSSLLNSPPRAALNCQLCVLAGKKNYIHKLWWHALIRCFGIQFSNFLIKFPDVLFLYLLKTSSKIPMNFATYWNKERGTPQCSCRFFCFQTVSRSLARWASSKPTSWTRSPPACDACRAPGSAAKTRSARWVGSPGRWSVKQPVFLKSDMKMEKNMT